MFGGTVLWMLAFFVVGMCICGAGLLALPASFARGKTDVLWIVSCTVLYGSPVLALILGIRGTLPGTRSAKGVVQPVPAQSTDAPRRFTLPTTQSLAGASTRKSAPTAFRVGIVIGGLLGAWYGLRHGFVGRDVLGDSPTHAAWNLGALLGAAAGGACILGPIVGSALAAIARSMNKPSADKSSTASTSSTRQ
jgi:hypothetical protein